MNNIIDRQTIVISININELILNTDSSIVTIPLNLRFAANELIVKMISYNILSGSDDIPDVIQIFCNITNDNLIASFVNDSATNDRYNTHFTISNSFQTGNFVLQLQSTDLEIDNLLNFMSPYYSINPQRLISAQNPQRTFGTVVLTIEFLKTK